MRVLGYFLLITLVSLSFTWAEEEIKFSMVELKVDKASLNQLNQLGIPLDCCPCEQDGEQLVFQTPLTQQDIALLKQNRISHKIITDDIAKFYANRVQVMSEEQIQATNTHRVGMKLGSMAGFYKMDEVQSTLDNLHKAHKSKNIMAQKISIGKSHEGRDIYMIKISDNADLDERDREPAVLYTAVHHAREAAGLMTVMYYMHYILENYETDNRVKNIVNNCELYFIRMINPDGYAYNQRTKPNGGGMWRKNRNGSGVDLNRNYGPQEYWNYPNSGSSTSPWSQTYRGTSVFSEAETRVVRDFVKSKRIITALNYHTYSNLLIYPYGIRDQLAHPKFREMAQAMTKKNKYRIGTAEGLLYAVRGVSDDWFYKGAGVFAMTPEVGGRSDGFWPRKSRIFPLAEENLEPNLLLAEYAIQLAATKK